MSGETRVCLLDASLYVFRAWHSLPANWRDAEGWPTHAVYGFTNTILQVLEQLRPQALAVCFDEALRSSFRNAIYPAYKANREPPDEALQRQFQHCQTIARALGLTVLAHAEYEADDLIGSLALKARAAGRGVLLLSADKDLAQLIDDGDELWDFGRDRRFDRERIRQHFGVEPEQIPDLLALAGDAIDNIPGVRGIGQLTAAKLLRQFGSLDALYERLAEVPYLPLRGAKSIANQLGEQRELAFLSQRLTRIALDAPVPTIAELAPAAPDLPALRAIYDRLGFGPVLRRRTERLAARQA